MDITVFVDFVILGNDVESEGALVYIATLDSRVEIECVLIVRIDLNAPPKSMLILAQLERVRSVPPQDQPGVVIDESADVVAQRVVKRARSDTLARTFPQLVVLPSPSSLV